MRALLPVWDSLVMLGPDLGGKVEGGMRERDETKEGDRRIDKDAATTGNVNPRPFFLCQTKDDESQVSETREMKIEMVSVPFTTCPFLGYGTLEILWKYRLNFITAAYAYYFLIHFFYTYHRSVCSASTGIC